MSNPLGSQIKYTLKGEVYWGHKNETQLWTDKAIKTYCLEKKKKKMCIFDATDLAYKLEEGSNSPC